MTRMLQSMKHRGPDSTGYALYRPAVGRLGHARQAGRRQRGARLRLRRALRRNRGEIEPAARGRVGAHGARPTLDASTHAMTVTFDYDGDAQAARRPGRGRARGRGALARALARDHQGPRRRARRWPATTSSAGLPRHARIGHVRMATESDVDISGAHPYWAYPFSDIAVVHNGQLTNYHQWKRRLERAGHRFQSECDSEIIAVYLAERMARAATPSKARCARSLDELDGVFTYICRDRRRARDGQGRAGGEAARPLRGRRRRRPRLRGDRDPRGRRPRDRHLRPVREAR